MKKFLLLLLPVFLMALCACSTEEDEPVVTPPQKTYSIEGVWTNGNYFISFDSKSFYVAYIDPKFIDCGSYTRNEKVIECSNSYFSTTTKYAITSISENSLSVKIDYIDVKGKAQSKSMTFSKSSKTPATKDHALIGKSFKQNVVNFGGITRTYSTYNTGLKTAGSGAAAKVPLYLYYIYIDGIVYEQAFTDGALVGSIGGWNVYADNGDITAYKIHVENGKLTGYEKVDL